MHRLMSLSDTPKWSDQMNLEDLLKDTAYLPLEDLLNEFEL